MTPLPRTSLILGGGGLSGIAWLIGVLAGLEREGFTLPNNCTLVGTSAGSVVSAQLAHGVTATTLFEALLSPSGDTHETYREYSQKDADAKNCLLMEKVDNDLTRARKRIGAYALRSETPSLETRRQIIRSRLSRSDWPARRLILTAVNTKSADGVVLDRSGSLSLTDAVMASCAVPGVWPPVPMGDAFLMDGGLRSMTNADLAIDSAFALVLAPLGYSETNPVSGHLHAELKQLRSAGCRVQAIVPDHASAEAIGDNVLDPSRRKPSARAGFHQGVECAHMLDDIWRASSRAQIANG